MKRALVAGLGKCPDLRQQRMPTLPSSSAARKIIEDEIERLIALLDLVDPDPDLAQAFHLKAKRGKGLRAAP
jgi:hypothetical protein